MKTESLSPAKYLVLSFAAIILAGAFMLMLPFSNTGQGTGFVNALFTSTSAVCVTGLTVFDTGTHFTFFGQFVIAMLIQIGGLGIMAYSVFIGLALGKGVGLFQRQIIQDNFGIEYTGKVRGLIVRIFLFVVAIESICAILLYIGWRDEPDAVWLAIFHSISAFCNAGFSTFSNNLEDFKSNPLPNFVIMFLIVAGGLGFIVVFELARKFSNRKELKKELSLHTKTVLIMTGILIFGGALMIYTLEAFNMLKSDGIMIGLMAALFQSVTTRTAGFNTIPIGALANSTLMIMTILMFIGASPGGTGGGVKTTTFVVFLADLKSFLVGREPEMGWRSIDRFTIEKSYLIIMVAMILVTGATFLMLVFEPDTDVMKLFFEVVSAYGTVGLSTGITPGLSVQGKLVIILCMFAGRLGPLTLVLAVGERAIRGSYRYPEGKIFLG